MQGAVELSFSFTEDEYVKASRTFYAGRYDAVFSLYLSVGVFMAGLLLAWLAADPYFGGSILVLGLVLLIRRFQWRWTLRRQFRRNPKFSDEYRLTFSDEGIRYRSKAVDSKIGWDFYSGVWETRDFYFLVYGKDLFSLLPKRAFRGPHHEAAFRELLRRKLKAQDAPGTLQSGAPEPAAEYVPPSEPPDWR
jgi:hypothetical protein